MESSPSSTCLQYQYRSISLPSRLHPQNTKIEAELTKLKTWQSSIVSSTVPTSGETIRTGLVGLAELYNCVEELINSPITQQALVQHRKGVLAEETLEGSIRLLDSCNVARDLFLMVKQNVQDLQSVLRRKGGDLAIERTINAFNSTKKRVKKESAKCLKALKKMENQIESRSLSGVNYVHLSNVITVLREVIIVTISVLRLLFLFLSMPAADSTTRSGGWSLIKKLVITRPRGDKIIVNEFGSVDVALQSMQGCIRNDDIPNNIDVQITRRRLEALGDSMEGLESGLDCLYRKLIRNRVSLLNVLAQ
ncbi:hypothetical protein RHSIM_Rhsim10G0203300 [Rhododendron simsii]|uniref:Uncharacterized protein n=1 Tax=Rhododendron simsii TaxID=118357 RepID=A0A834GEW1_RHOSS|nr:hypothetical protein RHSIM_Rhsim10G0203300 [Rhododendron simsii]